MTRRSLSFLVVVLSTSPILSAEPFPTKELVAIATRHQIPKPPKEARLVLAHTNSWTVLGNQSTSRDPGIYSPAFLLEEKKDEIVVLRGMEREVLHQRRNEPFWRPFALERVKPKPGGHAVEFNSLAGFVCAVQLASRGDEKNAQGIWEQLAIANLWNDSRLDESGERIPEMVGTPSQLLGRCIFSHLAQQVLQAPLQWPEIRERMKKLLEEFPALKTKQRTALFDDLTTTVQAHAPVANSTEALLLQWSLRPGELRHLGLFHRDNEKADAPAREILLRGFSAIPDLISLASDRRISVHHNRQRPDQSLLRVGELASSLLEKTTGERKTDSTAWREWWEKVRGQKEEYFFAAAVFRREGGKITWVNDGPSRILAHKYPGRLTPLCEEFSKHASAGAQPFALAEAVAASSQPQEKRVQILADFALRGTLAHKRCVLQQLAKLDGKKCAELLTPLLKALPADSAERYWTCPEAALAHVVMQIESDAIWREYLRASKRSSIGLRMEMMEPMNYDYIGEKNRLRRLAFLAAFLDDAEVRDKGADPEKFDGPCAGFTNPKMAVRDLAAEKIASILDVEDFLDEFSTAAEWSKLRETIRAKLATEKLPVFDQWK